MRTERGTEPAPDLAITEPSNHAEGEARLACEAHVARTAEVLQAEGVNPVMSAEVKAATMPEGWTWAVLAGMAEVVSLLGGRSVEVAGIREGSVLYAEEPVLVISGRFLEFAQLETAVIGTLSHATGVATVAARLKLAANGRPVYAFAARRVHPSIVPMVERAAYLGGCDSVSTRRGAELLGVPPMTTIDHDLALILGVPRAWTAFDAAVEGSVPRVASVDTLLDERSGALAAAESLGDRLDAVRLDVPEWRRGDLSLILREVRWELDARGYSGVQILIAGNLDEETLRSLARHADGFLVAGTFAAAPAIDFGFDIVEMDGRPIARRGRLSGRKKLWQCNVCGNRGIAPERARLEGCPRCGGDLAGLLVPLLGREVSTSPSWEPAEIRARALREAANAHGARGGRWNTPGS